MTRKVQPGTATEKAIGQQLLSVTAYFEVKRAAEVSLTGRRRLGTVGRCVDYRQGDRPWILQFPDGEIMAFREQDVHQLRTDKVYPY